MAESEEEVDVLVQRVVKDINNAFKKNPNIDEIGLIPCPEARYNRSPIVLVENSLGVESWCVKFLLPYVHNKLLLYRQRKQWLDREALVDITCTLLLLNPDFTTAWNVRKELVQCGVLNPERDLYLGKLALTKFPKSPETWIHRRWVLQQVLRECFPQGGARKGLGEAGGGAEAEATPRAERLQRALQEEMKVCGEAAGRYPSNYNAWSHRIWVLQNMAQGNLKVLHDELSSMKLWVSMHVSDHSGFHYRQFLLKALVGELSQAADWASPRPSADPRRAHQPNGEVAAPNGNGTGSGTAAEDRQRADVQKLFEEEIELCTDLIESYPGHETLWCHRRHVFFLWHHWRSELSQTGGCRGDESPGRSPLRPAGAGSGAGEGGAKSAQAMDVDGPSSGGGAGARGVGVGVGGAGAGGYTQDSKRLKRGPLQPGPPALHSEYSFVAKTLSGCRSPEQGRFATAYRKWLDSVIGQ
ncbi:protein prenyltransferase alpha subunit repeat-containing protein 1 [Anguilla anguilla]|uniref:protein prenyltransferase alpha subunit repeat-containing protein 1 n=1 Tax=Anguilla anguilla TaxID=7936 RepID=UPI0015B249BF|nr:protein prenyltransferase alpha subunit repeat-containing protein 1 [Anguilla anguilla]